jgi:hypothetical protein
MTTIYYKGLDKALEVRYNEHIRTIIAGDVGYE